MKYTYLITGANGHLGGTLVRMLSRAGAFVRGLILPGECPPSFPGVCYIQGDVRDKDSLRPLFEGLAGEECIVIHTAGIVDISEHGSDLLYDVNVYGTKNIIALCREYQAHRLVYVSSVHAIPEKRKHLTVLREVSAFSPLWVEGGYAKTKAEATQAVLDAAGQGLDAVVVHPSGIIGPYDGTGNHLVQMIGDYLHNRLPACVNGGYDFVDVRDVAKGCLLAAHKGRAGECYILSNRHYEVKEVLEMVRRETGRRRLPVLPMWMAKAAAPLMEFSARRRHARPLYTRYSLYTLQSNDRFSHDKASAELGYRPRDLRRTVADTVRWLTQHQPKEKTAPSPNYPMQKRRRLGLARA